MTAKKKKEKRKKEKKSKGSLIGAARLRLPPRR
jgi:hypothetical protein